MKKILIVGNPNVGKSSLFSALTGKFATISNYPGTTVEVAKVKSNILNEQYEVIDTPGAVNLSPQSEDEIVTEKILFNNPNTTVICVIDARQMRRGLALFMSIAELGNPIVVALNMIDEAKDRGIEYDIKSLEEQLGVPVVETVAVTKYGINKLRDQIKNAKAFQVPAFKSRELQHALQDISNLLPEKIRRKGISCLLLMNDSETFENIKGEMNASKIHSIHEIIRITQAKYSNSLSSVIGFERFQAADKILNKVLIKKTYKTGKIVNVLNKLSMHPFWGWPVLFLVMYATYLIVGVLGAGYCVDFFENVLFQKHLIPFCDGLLRYFLWNGAVEEFLISLPNNADNGGGLLIGQYGLISMGLSYAIAIIFPIVTFFFLIFALLEDTGYLPRLAVMMNKTFNLMGLNGKAVLPLVLGLGCDTMATMTTRILPTRKERILVILLLALGIPCSAQLGVILAMVATLSMKVLLIWFFYIMLILFITGYIGSKIIPGNKSDFIIEIPPIRRPKFKNVFLKTASRVEWYLREAVPLFILGTLVLWIMHRYDLISHIEQLFSPIVVIILGLPEKAAEAFLIGFLRRDYGAAGLYNIFSDELRSGTVSLLVEKQVLVSMVTMTLFMPCIANLFMIIKEKGLKIAFIVSVVVVVMAVLCGGSLRVILELMGW